MHSTHRLRALQAYRKLLIAQRTCFKGDLEMMARARIETRKHYQQNREESDEETIKDLVEQAFDLSEFLVKNVIQLRKEGEGRYSMKLENHHAKKDT